MTAAKLTPALRHTLEVIDREGWVDRHDIARRLYPPALNPKAWRCSTNGGPPGCYMAVGRAIRILGDRKLIEGADQYRITKPGREALKASCQ